MNVVDLSFYVPPVISFLQQAAFLRIIDELSLLVFEPTSAYARWALKHRYASFILKQNSLDNKLFYMSLIKARDTGRWAYISIRLLQYRSHMSVIPTHKTRKG